MSTTNQKVKYDADVIIVGAGPIGLTTANALRHHGINVLLLDERLEPSENSRANNVWSRPQEMLASIDLLDAFREKSYLVDHINVFIDQKPIERLEIENVSSPYPHVLYTGQDVIETTLIAKLKERNGHLKRGIKLLSVDQDTHGVRITYTDLNEDKKGVVNGQLSCRYLIGADGAKSTIRKSIDLDFETEKFEKRANRQIDARLTWKRSTEFNQLWFFTYHNGLAGVMPVWGGYHRLFFLEDQDLMPDREPTLEEIQARAREVTNDHSLVLTDPIWTSYSHFSHGVAKAYAKDCVFLVGDAGHQTLPIGGQGMNAGFHDAIGLAWRLAMQINGIAKDVVLNSYSNERQQEHDKLDKKQADGFRRLVYRNSIQDALLNFAGEKVPNIGSELLGTNDLQQLSVAYPDSDLSEDHISGFHILQKKSPKAGDRAPDAMVIDSKGQSVSLFSIIYKPTEFSWGWSLFLFDGRESDSWKETDIVSEVIAKWPFICPFIIMAAQHSAQTGLVKGAGLLYDYDGVAHAAYGLEGEPAIVLIRPDGHIGFRAKADKIDLLQTYCARLFI